jgi:hypothetical protein
MKLILTIDTEGDNQWDHGRELTVKNIQYVPRFQELCDKYSIRPTYLVTSEVCTDPFSKELFSGYIKNNRAEIGAHLHAWTTPPFEDKAGFRYNDPNHAYASEMSEELINEKIKILTDQVYSSFGLRPLSFRSGRYGFNEAVGRILSENSYIVDSSVTPFTDWTSIKGLKDGKGGPDFTDRDPFPYLYSFTEHSLVEIPVTVLPTRFPLTRYHDLARYYFRSVDNNIMLKVFRKFFYKDQPLWLRPFDWTHIGLFEKLINEASRLKLPFIVMMFHSSELMPGCSIYRTDNDSVERLYDLLDKFFSLSGSLNIASVTLSEAAGEVGITGSV